MPGFGAHHKHIPLSDADKVIFLQDTLQREHNIYVEHVSELVEALYRHYEAHPDKETEKLLIMHLGSEFFERQANTNLA